ncbi:hypothetical protein ACF3NV_09650 [Moraxella atlantae]|uniref:hypothetical protein n=1 Tax=Faucicola atlantae TaxID=34059 RepID=UPI003750AEE9
MPYLLYNAQHYPLELSPSQQIGAGGMGVVYRIGDLFGTGRLVAKVFKRPDDPKNPSLAKLQTMLARPPAHVQEIINGTRYTQFAWVQYLVFADDGRLMGYAMPELDFDRSISLNPFMYPREAARLTPYQNSLNYRVQLCANISALMADLHAHGHAFIDFKEQNLRLMPEGGATANDAYKGFIVGFIDCDSYRITDEHGHVYPAPVISPEMTSPEYHEHKDISRLDERHDRFVLAIELFKILNFGIHPFYFIPLSERLRNLTQRNTDQFIKERLYAYSLVGHPEIAPLKTSIHTFWDDGTRQMFDRAFLTPNPDDRPTAHDWEQHLRELSRQRQFVACRAFPDDASHIHFLGKPCHRCFLLGAGEFSPAAAPVPNPTHVTQTSLQPAPPSASPVPIIPEFDPAHHAAERVAMDTVNDTNDKVNNTNDTVANTAISRPATITRDKKPQADTSAAPRPTPPVKKQMTKSRLAPLMGFITAFVIGTGGLWAYSQSSPHKNTGKPANQTQTTAHAKPRSLAAINQQLPEARRQIDRKLADFAQTHPANQSGWLASRQAKSDARALYTDTLGLSGEFFDRVLATENSGQRDLKTLSNLAHKLNSADDIAQLEQTAQQAFRRADMAYFNQLPTSANSKSLAKQLNTAARNAYWNKRDPAAALYLQAQAVQNQPTHGEYSANLAFYLAKNNYPNAQAFVMYALQTPRAADRVPNTYMMELAAALAQQNGDTRLAEGTLLAQFYLLDDKAKRCAALLNYPKTYPDLVPVAQSVLDTLNRQAERAAISLPSNCKPPYAWATS